MAIVVVVVGGMGGSSVLQLENLKASSRPIKRFFRNHTFGFFDTT